MSVALSGSPTNPTPSFRSGLGYTQVHIHTSPHAHTHTHTQFIADRRSHNVSLWFQVRWWLVWLGLRCRGTVCLETRSTQPPGWNPPAWVSRTVNSVAWTWCDISTASSALKIQCSSTAFYLLEEIGGYVLECRGTLQVKVSRINSPLCLLVGAPEHIPTHLSISQGQRGHGHILAGRKEKSQGFQPRCQCQHTVCHGNKVGRGAILSAARVPEWRPAPRLNLIPRSPSQRGQRLEEIGWARRVENHFFQSVWV